MRRTAVIAVIAGLVISGFVYSQKRRLGRVGPIEGGGFLLNTGWRIQPAGTNIPLSTLPMSQALAPDGRTMAVLNAGYAPASVSLVDLETARETARVTIGDGWRGLAFSPAGDKLYIGGGGRGSLTEYSVNGTHLSLAHKIDEAAGERLGAPHLITDVVAGRGTVLVADQEQDKITVIDPAEERFCTVSRSNATHTPCCSVPRDNRFSSPVGARRKSSNTVCLTVRSWRESRWAPTEMAWLPAPKSGGAGSDDQPGSSPRLAVACANTNFVYVVEKQRGAWHIKEKINFEYVAAIQQGSASLIGSFSDQELRAYTRTVFENSPYRDSLLQKAGIPKGNPVPDTPGGITPIEHVILLMKENRTYDQILGDMKEGNGDPNLVLFGERVTPNHHKLAREFVLLDNFYVNADVSADGYYWTTAAIDPDTDQKKWPMEYGGRVYSPHGGATMFATMPNTPEGIRSTPGVIAGIASM